MTKRGETEALWTSTRVAKAFGVGVSSLKRWTDGGLLESVKTVGGHRRYRLDALHRFARNQGLPTHALPPLEVTINPDLRSTEEIIESLLVELAQGRMDLAGSTIAGYLGQVSDSTMFLDRVVGGLLARVGELWAQGEWTVEMEHRSAYCVADAIDRSRQPDPQRSPLAVLACPPGERHSIPLNMLRFVLGMNGWQSDFIGADVPWEALQTAVVRQSPRLVLLSARTDVPFSSPQFSRVAEVCRNVGATVCVGGSWVRGRTKNVRSVKRFRTLTGFERFLSSGEREDDESTE